MAALGTERTCRADLTMSVAGGRAEVVAHCQRWRSCNNQNLGVRKEVETHLVEGLKDRFDRNEFHSNELVYKTRKLGADHAHLN